MDCWITGGEPTVRVPAEGAARAAGISSVGSVRAGSSYCRQGWPANEATDRLVFLSGGTDGKMDPPMRLVPGSMPLPSIACGRGCDPTTIGRDAYNFPTSWWLIADRTDGHERLRSARGPATRAGLGWRTLTQRPLPGRPARSSTNDHAVSIPEGPIHVHGGTPRRAAARAVAYHDRESTTSRPRAEISVCSTTG